MIVFDLQSLADDSHRRHLIYPYTVLGDFDEDFIPDYFAYYDACDQDNPIEPLIEVIDGVYFNSSSHSRFYENLQIWTGTCESVRGKIIEWLSEYTLFSGYGKDMNLKMRPIGDERPNEQLFEEWFDHIGDTNEMVDMVFSANPAVVAMFRRRNVFTFDCNQEVK